jgi:hypothetical protein
MRNESNNESNKAETARQSNVAVGMKDHRMINFMQFAFVRQFSARMSRRTSIGSEPRTHHKRTV